MSEDPSSIDQVLGQLIILNGTSSAGKTSIAKVLQEKFKEGFLHVQMDTFWNMLPSANNAHIQDMKNEMRHALADTVGGFLKRGSNVILDIVFGEKTAALYQGYQPYLVGIKPHLEVLKAREIARGDRDIGLAESQFSTIHEGISYDLIIDNSSLTAAEAADKIIESYAQAKADPFPLKPANPKPDPNNKPAC